MIFREFAPDEVFFSARQMNRREAFGREESCGCAALCEIRQPAFLVILLMFGWESAAGLRDPYPILDYNF